MAGSSPLLSEIFTRISPNPSHCAPITAARRCSNLGLPTPNFVWRSPIWNPGSQQPMAAAVASPKLGFAFVRREGARGCESVSTATRIRTCSLSELADGRWDDSLRGSAHRVARAWETRLETGDGTTGRSRWISDSVTEDSECPGLASHRTQLSRTGHTAPHNQEFGVQRQRGEHRK